jgi:hypothetical protein
MLGRLTESGTCWRAGAVAAQPRTNTAHDVQFLTVTQSILHQASTATAHVFSIRLTKRQETHPPSHQSCPCVLAELLQGTFNTSVLASSTFKIPKLLSPMLLHAQRHVIQSSTGVALLIKICNYCCTLQCAFSLWKVGLHRTHKYQAVQHACVNGWVHQTGSSPPASPQRSQGRRKVGAGLPPEAASYSQRGRGSL